MKSQKACTTHEKVVPLQSSSFLFTFLSCVKKSSSERPQKGELGASSHRLQRLNSMSLAPPNTHFCKSLYISKIQNRPCKTVQNEKL